MNNKVTIILYHYVRDLKNSRYPGIKGLDIDLFKEQVAYLKKHYTIITMEQLIDSIDNDTALPAKSALLTFDDAYIDHYTQVFPVLVQNNIQGSFYPPVRAIKEHIVLDVNRIHHILVSGAGNDKIIAEIYKLLDHYRREYYLESNEFYYEKFALADRFDTADTIFIKRLLQKGLDEQLRNIITKELFKKFIGMSESTFACELYMNIDQIRIMKHFGMHIGSHGFNHYWLGSLSNEKQEIEIDKSLEFLKLIGSDLDRWTMCYPYGNYNIDTLNILYNKGCKLALTTKVGIADLNEHKRFELPRLDTNDIPINANADTNQWFDKA